MDVILWVMEFLAAMYHEGNALSEVPQELCLIGWNHWMYESVGGGKRVQYIVLLGHIQLQLVPTATCTKQMTSKQDLTTQIVYVAVLTNKLARATILNEAWIGGW